MQILSSDEFRLGFALILNGAILVFAWQAARRLNADFLQAITDALLLFFLIQYIAVALPGLLGILNLATMAGTAIALAAGFFLISRRMACPGEITARNSVPCIIGSIGFVVGYIAVAIWFSRLLPVMSIDALVYHMPAAAQWLRTGHLGLYETWFWNPANTFSPLGGSTFIAWLIAPLGNDILARFVQVPAFLLIFFAMLQLARGLGAGISLASILAIAAVLARPFVSHIIIVKDDLFLAAFFLAAVAALVPDRLRDRVAPWRIGIALGLFLSIKYPALLALPILLLIVDLPIRSGWRWRQGAIVIAVVSLLAGPWFIRNIYLTGNPIYPTQVTIAGVRVFDGLMPSHRSDLLGTPDGLWKSLVTHYHALQPAGTAVLILGWLAALLIARRRALLDPLTRLCLIGPLVGLSLFLLLAPYAEIRFLYPGILLMIACWIIVLRSASALVGITIASILALGAAAGGFIPTVALPGILVGAVLAGIAIFATLLPISAKQILAIVLLLALPAAIYVHWPAYIADCRDVAAIARQNQYGALADAWNFIDREIPPGSTIAYTNAHLVRPMLGFNYERQAIYIPTRPDVRRIQDLPKIHPPVGGEQLVPAVARLLLSDPSYVVWQQRLKDSGARYMVIFTQPMTNDTNPKAIPELNFTQQDPSHFIRLFDNSAAVVYRVAWD